MRQDALSKEEETARQLVELRKERDALQIEVEQLKSGKMNERHFSAAFQKEFEKREEFQAKYHQVLDQCSVSGFQICMELIWFLYSHSVIMILLSSFDYFYEYPAASICS